VPTYCKCVCGFVVQNKKAECRDGWSEKWATFNTTREDKEKLLHFPEMADFHFLEALLILCLVLVQGRSIFKRKKKRPRLVASLFTSRNGAQESLSIIMST
jgi:hypothetical protein